MSNPHAISNYGTLFQRENYPGSGTYQTVAETYNIKPPELSAPVKDITHHSSGGERQYMVSPLKENGEAVVTMAYLATGTVNEPAYAAQFIVDRNNGTKRGYQIDWPTATAGGSDPTGTYAPGTWQFNGVVTKAVPSEAPASDPNPLQLIVTLKVTDSYLILVS